MVPAKTLNTVSFVDAARLVGPSSCGEFLGIAMFHDDVEDPADTACDMIRALERQVQKMPLPRWIADPSCKSSDGCPSPLWENSFEEARVTLELSHRGEADKRFFGVTGRAVRCCLAAEAFEQAVNGLGTAAAELAVPGWTCWHCRNMGLPFDRTRYKAAKVPAIAARRQASIEAWAQADLLYPAGAPSAALDDTGIAQAFRAYRATFWAPSSPGRR